MRFILFFIAIFNINSASSQSKSDVYALDNEPIKPIPLTIPLSSTKIALGKKLFEDPFLAHDEKQSCSQCHQLNQGGADNTYRSTTNTGKYDLINTPTIFNVIFNVRHTWRGKFKTLEMQAQADLHNPRHANTNWNELLAKISKKTAYKYLFSAIYGHRNIDKEMVLDALATYEKSLITPNAPFDKYLRGEKNTLSLLAKKGYLLFKSYGCIACHQGINIGGNMFQKLGIFGDYFKHRKENITKADYGRFNVTGLEHDRYVFRVPSLRNVEVTAPYFHDGRAKTLDDVIDIMAKHQLGRRIPKQDKTAIIEFLKSLTGEYKGKSLSGTIEK